jgi:PAS domain-containing protein
MPVTPAAAIPAEILDDLEVVFGARDEPVEAVARRARERLDGRVGWIVWEGDAQTFAFSYVSPSAAAVLGHPAERWTTEPTFWADVVVDSDHRDEAIAFCAVATGMGRDHEFEYRACHLDGTHRWLYDAVLVLRGARGVPERLRGIMLDVTPWRDDPEP